MEDEREGVEHAWRSYYAALETIEDIRKCLMFMIEKSVIEEECTALKFTQYVNFREKLDEHVAGIRGTKVMRENPDEVVRKSIKKSFPRNSDT